MLFWKNKNKNKNKNKVDSNFVEEVSKNPYICFEIIESGHINIDISWPVDQDLTYFIKMIASLNSGKLAAKQIVEAACYASKIGRPGDAVAIAKVLEPFLGGSKSSQNDEQPVVPSSRVVYNMIKASGQ